MSVLNEVLCKYSLINTREIVVVERFDDLLFDKGIEIVTVHSHWRGLPLVWRERIFAEETRLVGDFPYLLQAESLSIRLGIVIEKIEENYKKGLVNFRDVFKSGS